MRRVEHWRVSSFVKAKLVAPSVADNFVKPMRHVVKVFAFGVNELPKCSFGSLLPTEHRFRSVVSCFGEHVNLTCALNGFNQLVAPLQCFFGRSPIGWRDST